MSQTTSPTGQSLDLTAENIARLRQLFPDAVSEGRVDFDRLRAALGAAGALAPTGPDHYELHWAGKAEARREVQRQTTATLVPEPARGVDFDTTENVFIEGENLEVLRVLQRGYFGKVKLIYIDPPYNTGSDSFVYPDDYGERREDYEKAIGARDENGFLNRQVLWKKNTRESGQYHSAWLNMMWPRLYLSRNLLREDGVIFVSIDDHEVHNLRLLLNEVFGEENFVAELVWQRAFSPINLKKHFSESHDYVLCYAKNIGQLTIKGLSRDGGALERYKNLDNDPRGAWASGGIDVGPVVASKVYPITTPSGREVLPPSGYCWRFSQERFAELVADNRIWFGKDGSNVPRYKRFLTEVKDRITPMTLWLREEVGDSQSASRELKALFDNQALFDYPKPVGLIRRCLELLTEGDDLILDFFAGSGTTGHAVLELNAQDGGNRRFLLVQMPEEVSAESEAYKAGYQTVADITRARLAKVSARLRATQAGQLPLTNAPDTGFRAYRLAPSNFRAWRPDVQLAPDVLAQLELFQEPLRDPATATEAVLTELLLKMAGGADLLPLSVAVTRREVAGLVVHEVAGGLLWLALAGISPEVVAAAGAARPQRLVVPGRFFGGDNPDEQVSNARLQLADAGVVLQLI